MFRTNKASSLAGAALRGEQNVLWRQRGTAGAKPWSASVMPWLWSRRADKRLPPKLELGNPRDGV